MMQGYGSKIGGAAMDRMTAMEVAAAMPAGAMDQWANAAEQRKASEIEGALDDLASSLHMLNATLAELGKRLGPVLAPTPEKEGAEGAVRSCGSAVGQAIVDQAARVRDAERGIRGLLASLAV